MNWRLVARLMGNMLVAFSPAYVLPLVFAAVHGEVRTVGVLVSSLLATLVAGAGMRLLGHRERTAIFRREALLVVGLAWVVIPAFGALPFLLSGLLANPVDALFESMSGFTTTGASVFTAEEFATAGVGLHFWRMQLHWYGGLGITLLFVAILPSLGIGGKTLLRSEASGPITAAEEPRVRVLLRSLILVYVGMTATLTAGLWLLTPMVFWEALGHAMSTVGTGGLSSDPDSIAGFNSPMAAALVTVFMVLCGTNLHLFVLLFRGRWHVALRDAELRAYYTILLVSSLIVAWQILERHGGNLLAALGHGTFTVVSVVTTTGFATENFDEYPPLARMLVFFLLFIGASSGSTAGGLKVYRLLILFRAGLAHMQHAFRPNRVSFVRVSGEILEPDLVRSVGVHFFAYVGLFVMLTLAVSADAPDFETAISASIACIANVGPGLSAVGPVMNFSEFADGTKLLLSFAMLLGRIEIFPLLTLLTPAFWRR